VIHLENTDQQHQAGGQETIDSLPSDAGRNCWINLPAWVSSTSYYGHLVALISPPPHSVNMSNKLQFQLLNILYTHTFGHGNLVGEMKQNNRNGSRIICQPVFIINVHHK